MDVQSPEARSHAKECLYLGLGMVPVFLATGAALFIPPWVGFILWTTAAVLTVIGIAAARLPRLAMLGLRIVAIVVAFALWLASSPRAELQVTGFKLVPRSNPLIPHQIVANVTVKNKGRYAAAVFEVHATLVYEDPASAPNFDTFARQLRLGLASAKTLASQSETRTEGRLEPDAEGLYSDSSPALTDTKIAQFYTESGFIGIAGEFEYSDWWPFERAVPYCAITRANNDNVWTNCFIEQ